MKPPIRIQLSRRKGFQIPPNTVSVARPSQWGNPHRVGFCPVCGADHTQQEAVAEFRAEVESNSTLRSRISRELAGKNLACWCRLDEPCHADVLLSVANAPLGRSARRDDPLRGNVGT